MKFHQNVGIIVYAFQLEVAIRSSFFHPADRTNLFVLADGKLTPTLSLLFAEEWKTFSLLFGIMSENRRKTSKNCAVHHSC